MDKYNFHLYKFDVENRIYTNMLVYALNIINQNLYENDIHYIYLVKENIVKIDSFDETYNEIDQHNFSFLIQDDKIVIYFYVNQDYDMTCILYKDLISITYEAKETIDTSNFTYIRYNIYDDYIENLKIWYDKERKMEYEGLIYKAKLNINNEFIDVIFNY